ncbi:MAG: YceI family protein [Gammaproteobacteria bacterium]|nr:YceI family protein [Gammaproteobacteria bacterium]
MKTNILLAIAAISATASTNAADLTAVPSGKYTLDPTHAYIHFSYNHLGLSEPQLSFDDFSVELTLDNQNVAASSVAVTIDPTSVETGSEIFHDHLTGADWFDTASFPQISFNSASITEEGDKLMVDGELTIKGQSKPITLDVTVNNAMEHPMAKKPVIGITGTAKLKRSDFGLGNFAPYVGDDVSIRFTAELLAAE